MESVDAADLKSATEKYESSSLSPGTIDITNASIAQLVEQWTENPRVGGSIPSRCTIVPLIRQPWRAND